MAGGLGPHHGCEAGRSGLPIQGGRFGELLEAYHRQRALRSLDADWLFVSTPLHLPIPKRERWICSVLDVIALEDPRYRRTRIKNRLALGRVRQAEQIVALAQFTADRIVHFAGVDRGSIAVIPLPVGDAFRNPADSPAVDRPYVMAMADLRTPDPRKRSRWLPSIARLLDAHGLDLRVAGDVEEGGADFGGCRTLGRLPDEELAGWMRGAACFVSLSAYEGQGLPPLEAMTTGAPVLAFANSAVTESIGVSDFLIAEPGLGDDEELPAPVVAEMVERIRAFVDDRDKYEELARAHAAFYHPDVFFPQVQQLADSIA